MKPKYKNNGRIAVAVFFGGRSVEHEVSVISGLQAYYAFDTEKYFPIPVYITKDGDFYTGGNIGEIEAYKDIPALLKSAQRVLLVKEKNGFYLVRYPFKRARNNTLYEIEVAFPVVHGTNVEDGTLQGYFKSVGIPFVGCDVTASAVGMDKSLTKAALKGSGVPVLDCLCLNGKTYHADRQSAVSRIEEATRYPVIVKPVNLGSSVGIKKAANRDELMSAAEDAFSYAPVVLFENAVENLKEINCSVVGDRYEATASVTEEPVGAEGILTFADKYMSASGSKTAPKSGAKTGGTKGAGMANLKRRIPADIPADVEQKVKEYSVKAFKTIGCSGVTRIDYLYDTQSGELYLNELNTIPGSLSYYLWEAAGMPFDKLLDKLVSLALKRKREEDELSFSFDTNLLAGVKLPHGAKTVK